MTVDSGSAAAVPPASVGQPPDPAAARPWPRSVLGAVEHGIYRVLRVPVFILLEAFRRYAGR